MSDELPAAVNRLIFNVYKGPDTFDLVRQRLKRHYKPYSKITNEEILAVINRGHYAKRDQGKKAREEAPNNRITMPGPAWSWPTRKEFQEYDYNGKCRSR